ncbi:MAG: tetratricopeptide repeat protein, partial [Bacteroidales bacterium]|nr:tetratricopeptide repeat protein [Bacteroidales bacterium]
MAQVKIIKIFLASSDELKNDRNAFGNLVRRLDMIYEKRGIRIELFEWEDADAAYNNRPKQDEFDDEVRASDMFLALFHKKGGKFTIKEFDVASEEFRRTGIKPKAYVYCRELREGEEESAELKEFKHRLFNELGHYWCNYNNEDSLQLHFVMQLQLVENKRLDELKVEDGEVTLDGTTVARMDNLRFAADNPDYQRMRQRLMELPALIEKASQRKNKYPDDEDLRNELQKLLNERNNLQEVFKQQQEFLFDTAKRIAQLHGEQITDRMRRAIEAFDRGDVHEANIILDEAQRDAAQNLTDYRESKALTEQRRQNVIHSIEELLLNTSTMMADASIAIKERIEKTKSLYAQADELAAEIDYDKEKYSDLLFNYARFMFDYGFYWDSEAVYLRQIPLAEKLYGTEHEKTATFYNNIGLVYQAQGDYPKALEYHFKALDIQEKVLGPDHPDSAISYHNIGTVYNDQGDYTKALEYYFKALEISENVLGKEHPFTANSYNNIGTVYRKQSDYPKALEYYFKALIILEKVLGTVHPDTATSYNTIGTVYNDQGDYTKALESFFKALDIREKVFGPD